MADFFTRSIGATLCGLLLGLPQAVIGSEDDLKSYLGLDFHVAFETLDPSFDCKVNVDPIVMDCSLGKRGSVSLWPHDGKVYKVELRYGKGRSEKWPLRTGTKLPPPETGGNSLFLFEATPQENPGQTFRVDKIDREFEHALQKALRHPDAIHIKLPKRPFGVQQVVKNYSTTRSPDGYFVSALTRWEAIAIFDDHWERHRTNSKCILPYGVNPSTSDCVLISSAKDGIVEEISVAKVFSINMLGGKKYRQYLAGSRAFTVGAISDPMVAEQERAKNEERERKKAARKQEEEQRLLRKNKADDLLRLGE